MEEKAETAIKPYQTSPEKASMDKRYGRFDFRKND
jgi:hypothetical protein